MQPKSPWVGGYEYLPKMGLLGMGWLRGTGYWVLGTGYWVLGTGYWEWVLGYGYVVSDGAAPLAKLFASLQARYKIAHHHYWSWHLLYLTLHRH